MNGMKDLKFFLLAIVAALSACSLQDDDGERMANAAAWPDAIVTIKTRTSGETFFQLDDSTTLEPVGWKNPYRREIRALVKYDVLSGKSEQFSCKISVSRVDTIRTKNALAVDEPEAAAVRPDGGDPVDIVFDWLTVCEDGYLTVHFGAKWGVYNRPHLVNLLANTKTRELEFIHSAEGDEGGSVWKEGIVAFKISELFSRVEEDEMILTLKWQSYNGPQTQKLVYKVRRQ